MAFTLSPPVFAILSLLIEERTGLHYPPADAALLETRIAQRATDLGFESPLDYYYYLRYDAGGAHELQMLVESLVVHETYFFREMDSLTVVARSIVPEMLRERPTLRLWSAACATGEEPYSIALLLEEAGLLERVEILATDISAPAIARAREAVYSGRSLRALPSPALLQGLEPTAAGMRVREDVRRRVSWARVNLVEADAVRALGAFDVVLCRNVLIYFADATVCAVAATLADVIRPGGVLVVGASESLLRFGTVFSCEERGGSFFYRRPAP